MEITSLHEELADSVRAFVRKEINPYVEKWEADQIFPAHDLFKKMGDADLLGIKYDEQYGGLGLDLTYAVVATEAMGESRCGGVPLAVGVQTDMCTPALANFGSAELKEQFLKPAIAGESVGCIGVSEPGAGSDVASLRTTAVRDGDDYVINGTKMWITNGMQADWCCLLANTSDGPVHKNKSLIVVPMDTPGIERTKIAKMGMHSSDTAQLFFDDVRVPGRNLIGEEGMGFIYQMKQFQEERLWGAAWNLGTTDRLVTETITYLRDRKAFGQSLLDNQVIHYRLAELRTEIEALRALTYRAAADYVSGEDATRLASMAKLKSGRLMREVTDACVQFWGGMGFANESQVSQFYRDGRLSSIGGGADEVMLSIIAKLEGTLPTRTR
ncbi:acyl-CoA dehydrogenase family protein [Gordonia rhizosphera]|uniref:Acyl-CoA dehydrogenase n=1 Tax=Gordonia rhizosphera NBRC 16068 TaxID=1108045 RepID=K6WFA7_9ACTN|nr:acyl-CoA dehydrogenase family protein [Gordonia rhizosphera]GAB90837.1 acyl-CoA dehydrogenase [Gordonia rhizosphera NBRC 16068]